MPPLASSTGQSSASAGPSPESTGPTSTKKRNSTTGALDSNGNVKPVKRRAAKACAACRSRKVRCDVMNGFHTNPITGEGTCSNCHMDGIKCVIEESRRRKKHGNGASSSSGSGLPIQTPRPEPLPWANGGVNPSDINTPDGRRWSGGTAISNDLRNAPDDFSTQSHIPHSIYQSANTQISSGNLLGRGGNYMQRTTHQLEVDPAYHLLTSASISRDRTGSSIAATPPPPQTEFAHPDSIAAPIPILKHQLPSFLKPLPSRMTDVDIDYLFAKGALSVPEAPVRDALLRSYLEYVHPYMPLVELPYILQIIHDGGASGHISLLLFQSLMFAGTAFVDMEFLHSAGYSNRKEARKAFFQKARVLYDFDYEIDRVSLVQSLLLMTYWYETPDDQKDTWHWMGVAISLAHTIGLHRNPIKSSMEPEKKKLWKRIWWSCFMRDRLVALGMRRPTRIKEGDYDVPMLELDDFEICAIPASNTIIPDDCKVARDEDAQRELAHMCIAKAKLCISIGHVLSAQYSVLIRDQGVGSSEGSTRSSVMLFPKKSDQTEDVERCDKELSDWVSGLPACCHYRSDLPEGDAGAPVFVQRALLHMIYLTTLSALHRPQVLPSGKSKNPSEKRAELQDLSRKKVSYCSKEITRIAKDLHSLRLEKYLPTTGVTVLLPAIIIHLLDIKSANDEAQREAREGFCQCMQVLEQLRDSYASADYATQFLEAAIRKANIDIVVASEGFGRGMGSTVRNVVASTINSRKMEEYRAIMRERAGMRTPPSITADEAMGMREADHVGIADIGGMPVHEMNSAPTPPESDNNSTENINSQHVMGNFDDSALPQHGFMGINHNDMGMLNGVGGFSNTVVNGGGNGGYAGGEIDAMSELFDFTGGVGGFNAMAGREQNEASVNAMDGAGWNVPLEEGAHGESGGFMDDMTWIEHGPSWSQMGTPNVGGDMHMFGTQDGSGGNGGGNDIHMEGVHMEGPAEGEH